MVRTADRPVTSTPAVVAGHHRVGEVVVVVAVEDLAPPPGGREAQLVAVERGLVEAEHHQHVLALEGQDPVVLVGRVHRDRLAAQPGQFPAHRDQVAGAAQEVGHHPVLTEGAVPPDQPVGPPGAVRPQLVLEELLTHEQHRGAGRGQQQAGGHPGAAARVPGPGVVAAGQPGDPRGPVVLHVQHQVMVLQAVVRLPGEVGVGRPVQGGADPVQADPPVPAGRRRAEHAADRVADAVGVPDVEPHPLGHRPHRQPAHLAPVLGDQRGGRLAGPQRGGHLLAEAPATPWRRSR